MTLWVDRADRTASARGRTHALIVATSDYRHLPGGEDPAPASTPTFGLGQLRTPCAGALAFARWLRIHYYNPDAPLATIRLLLSPSETELRASRTFCSVASRVEPTTCANVERELFAWQNSCTGERDGVAILYASGHGLQLTRDESIVLLHDFAATPNVMTNALDTGRVLWGMAGESMPKRQWFFVDACRSQPTEWRNWEHLGSPLGLPVAAGGEDRRCAPVFFSASPDTPAFGRAGHGTLFSRALLESLKGFGAAEHTDPEGRWQVTTLSLLGTLDQRVPTIAAEVGVRQTVVGGGLLRDEPFHFFDRPPPVPFSFQLDPGEAYPHVAADLWDSDRTQQVLDGERFEAPVLVRRIPAGLYSLDVRIQPPMPPYVPKNGLACFVNPRRTWRMVRVA